MALNYLYSVVDIDKDKSSQDIVTGDANENANGESEREPKSHSGSELAGPSYGEIAADATAYLERSGSSLEGFGGDPKEIDRQAAA